MEGRRPRRGRSSDQMIPDDRSSSAVAAKVCMQMQPRNNNNMNIKKVQVVYYLSRNGQLEHPHYMEVSYLSNHHLRLRDIMDRLTVLRGKGMPSLYSWSCKRSYRNGYVWNDLSKNDVIYPTDGAEYVLKGSELLEGSSERVQQLHGISSNIGNRQIIQEPNNFHSKRKELLQETHNNPKYTSFNQKDHDQESQESQEEYEDEEKTSYTSSTTPHSRCSIGVSTDELLDEPNIKKTTTESTQHNSPPPPPSTPSVVLTEKPRNQITTPTTSQRFEVGDPIPTELAPGRNSVLLQLIACGNLGVGKAKNNLPNSNSNSNYVVKRSESDLHKGVLYKSAVKVKVGGEEEEMIRCMSENPRFGNLQSEEKEYFSGSIVAAMSENRVADEPGGLKRSNSYNDERGVKVEMEETVKEVVKERSGGVGGKCIPLKKSLLSSKQTKKWHITTFIEWSS